MNEGVERRPNTRLDLAPMRRLAHALADRGVSPNAISMVGLLFGVLGGLCFFFTEEAGDYAGWLWIAGAILVQLRLLGSTFDGMVAILRERASAIGQVYNDVPDRVSDSLALVGFGFALNSTPWLGLVAALAANFTAHLRTMGKAAGGCQQWCGPMAKQQRMYLVSLAALFVGFGGESLLPDGKLIGEISVPSATLWLIVIGCVVTSFRRFLRIRKDLENSKQA